jgi:L-fuculose-phosphate aldolase
MFNNCYETLVRMVVEGVLRPLAQSLPSTELEKVGSILVQSLTEVFKQEQDFAKASQLLNTCYALQELGFFQGTSGNVSIRLNAEELLITPSGINKGQLTPADLVKINLAGEKLAGVRNPSSEFKLHTFCYKQRPDINAIVHAHPPFAMGFAAAGISLDMPVLPEAIVILGKVPLLPYATPSTNEVPLSFGNYIYECNAFLLANHGAVTLGRDMAEAQHRMETLELFAKVILLARILGGEKLLSEEQLQKLAEIK